ncbi:hypothetical protein F5Y06DRAFT_303332 [Hypoxylon sp. FL0890]|nr:hypothetical protein F5Y06DRAFT_303332 [Hypoxylon sp. FL0890]
MAPKKNNGPRLDLRRTYVLDDAQAKTRQGRIRYGKRWPNKDADAAGNTILPANWRNSRRTLDAWDALHMLQYARGQFLDPQCIKEPLAYYIRTLPEFVQADIRIMEPGTGDVFGCDQDTFDDWLDNNFDPRLEPSYDKTPKNFRPLYERPYVFWPIDSKPRHTYRWMAVIIHLEQRLITNPNWNEGDDEADRLIRDPLFRRIESIAVIDPDVRRPPRHANRVYNRVFAILEACGITADPNFTGRSDLWVPPQNPVQHEGPDRHLEGPDKFSSGLHCFDIIRQMCMRVTNLYCTEPGVHNEAEFWRPLSGWFNPDAVRAEMIGYAAMRLNYHMEYTTRVTIEPIAEMLINHKQKRDIQQLEPDGTYVKAYIPGDRDKNGHALMWDDPLDSDKSSVDDDDLDDDDVFGPPGGDNGPGGGDDDDDDDDNNRDGDDTDTDDTDTDDTDGDDPDPGPARRSTKPSTKGEKGKSTKVQKKPRKEPEPAPAPRRTRRLMRVAESVNSDILSDSESDDSGDEVVSKKRRGGKIEPSRERDKKRRFEL